MSTVDSAVVRQAVSTFLADLENNPTATNQFLNDPYSALAAANFPLPSVSDPDLAQAVQQTYNNLNLVPSGAGVSTRKRFAWSGDPDSVACWACLIVGNTVIWGGIVALTATAFYALGPASPLFLSTVAANLGLPVATVSAAAATATSATAATAGVTGAGWAAIVAAVGGVVAVTTFVNSLVQAICDKIPNCCSAAEPADNGIWNADSTTGGDSTLARPALTISSDGSTLAMANQDNNVSNPWLWLKFGTVSTKSWNGHANWVLNPATNDKCKTSVGPALAYVSGTLYCVYVDGDPNSSNYGQLVYMSTANNGGTWNAPQAVFQTPVTTRSPALAPFGNKLYCIYADNSGNLQCTVGTPSGGSVTWAASGLLGGVSYPCGNEPGVGVFQNQIIVIYRRPAPDVGLWFTSSQDGTSWTPPTWLPDHIVDLYGIGVAATANLAICVYKGTADTNLRYATSPDGKTWSPEFRCDSNLTSQGPAVAGAGATFFAIYKGGSNEGIQYAIST